MKNLMTSLMAIVMFGFSGYAQTKITHDGAKKIAVEHNKFLENLLLSNASTQENVNDYFKSLKFENITVKQQEQFFTSYSYESNLELLKKHVNNKFVFEIINNSNLIVGNETLDLKVIKNKLDDQIKLAKEKLTDKDLEICLVYIEVLKKSSEFWLEKERGGNGIGYLFLNTTSNKTSKKGVPKSHKVIAADALGASGALIIGGIAAGFSGPIAPLSFFAVVGASAAWSSGCAALGF